MYRDSLTVGLVPQRLHSIDYLTRGSAFDKRQTYDATARGFYFFTAMNLIERVIAALNQNIGQQLCDQRTRRDIVKDCYAVDAFEGCENLRAIIFTHQRPAFALQLAHGRITVDCYD